MSNKVYIDKKLRCWTFWLWVPWYPENDTYPEIHIYMDYWQFWKMVIFHIWPWYSVTVPTYRMPFFLESVLGMIKQFLTLFGRFSAEKCLFRSVYIRKFIFVGQKIQKNLFFKKWSKSHLSMYIESETCLGTSKDHFSVICTCINHYLPLSEK